MITGPEWKDTCETIALLPSVCLHLPGANFPCRDSVATLNRCLFYSHTRLCVGLHVPGTTLAAEMLQGAWCPRVEKLSLSFANCHLTDEMIRSLCSRIPSGFPLLNHLDLDISQNPLITSSGMLTVVQQLTLLPAGLVLKLFFPHSILDVWGDSLRQHSGMQGWTMTLTET